MCNFKFSLNRKYIATQVLKHKFTLNMLSLYTDTSIDSENTTISNLWNIKPHCPHLDAFPILSPPGFHPPEVVAIPAPIQELKTNEIDKLLSKLAKRWRENIQTNKIRNKKGTTTVTKEQFIKKKSQYWISIPLI